MRRYIIAKVVTVILLLGLATAAAGAQTTGDIPTGMGGGASGAGVGNY